jgi:hypothetical protein
MLQEDPELKANRIPKYFIKISNAYYMSAYRYYNQEITKSGIVNNGKNLKKSLNEAEASVKEK